jgi:DNA-binding NarL/FixJ family response regulator
LELLFISKSGMQRDAWSSLLQSFSGLYGLTTVNSASDGIKLYSAPTRQPELIIIEGRSSGQEGLTFLNQVKKEWLEVRPKSHDNPEMWGTNPKR